MTLPLHNLVSRALLRSTESTMESGIIRTKMKFRLLGVVCFFVLCITLALGLWPFHVPKNDVTWLSGANGLVFGRNASAMSSAVLKTRSSQQERERGAIEIWVQPDHWTTSATILALYRPEDGVQFALRQSLTDLEVRVETQTGQRKKMLHFFVDDALGPALRRKKPVLITVTSGQSGMKVYLDGILAKVGPQFQTLEGTFTGRLILADAPEQPDNFRGRIRGLAIYEDELDNQRVSRHYKTWARNGRPDIAQDEHDIALYLFNERIGEVVRNHSAAGRGDLYIPRDYEVVDKISLEPFWREFNFSRGYWSGNIKNIVGFIPFGFCFFALCRIAIPRRAIFVTLALGASVSLTIEILQAFLPMRDSGTTDIITNVLGTWIGALCYKRASLVLLGIFPWMGTPPEPEYEVSRGTTQLPCSAPESGQSPASD